MRAMAREEEVCLVVEAASVLLQARLPVTSSLLSRAFGVARNATAVDSLATLQLGSWGVIMQSGTAIVFLALVIISLPGILAQCPEVTC